MKSFVISIADFFRMEQSIKNVGDFDKNKKALLIPKYQREYKWKNEQILSLIKDIKNSSKFLGNVILDESNDHYEIVDGQQRITTLLLILSSIHNQYCSHPMEQESILNYIKPNGKVILKNDTIGDFIKLENSKIELSILDKEDIYNQKPAFYRAYKTINEQIDKIKITEIPDLKNKLLGCRILVLINDDNDRVIPVEQLFLDINEKAQHLEVEDVFKGHCFEKFTINQEELKQKWVALKKVAMSFSNFGFLSMSQYIYLYLLETENSNMSENLIDSGKHYLDDKTMDQISNLIDSMINFGESVIKFANEINNSNYYFLNLCKKFETYKNTEDRNILKSICSNMINYNGKAIYQKIPLMYFVYYLNNHSDIVEKISFDDFRKILTNLYIYMALFVFSGTRKSKKSMDHSIYEALNSSEPISKTVEACRKLRKEKVEEFELPKVFNSNKHFLIYSIMDNYNPINNSIKKLYLKEDKYTHEHFILNQNNEIEWINGAVETSIDIPLDLSRKYKNKAINGLVIDETLNGQLGSKDIITKISIIETWYNNRDLHLPVHIAKFIDCIKSFPEYNSLLLIKDTVTDKSVIEQKYYEFLYAFFNDENELTQQLTKKFKDSFKQRG